MRHPDSDDLERFVASLEDRELLSHVLECAACRERLTRALEAPAPPAVGRPAAVSREGARRNEPALPVEGFPGGPLEGVEGKVLPFVRRDDWARATARLTSSLGDAFAACAGERREAEVGYRELLAYPEDRRDAVVRNCERFRSWDLAVLLFEEGREAAFDDTERAEGLARLGLAVAGRLDRGVYGERAIADLEARGWVLVGRARRLASDLEGAERAFERAASRIAGTLDPVERALYLYELAGLRRDQTRFDRAQAHLAEAARLFDEAGDSERAARAMTQEAAIQLDRGEPAAALEPLERALALLDERRDPRAALYARHNLALALAELGRYVDARRVLARCREGYRRFPDRITQRVALWLEGVIAFGTGELDRAEELLRGICDDYTADAMTYHAAISGLDLAAVYARQGRNAELAALTEELAPILAAGEFHREALTAFSFFRLAVEQERATVEVVRRVSSYLKRSRQDPSLPFDSTG